MTCSSDRVSRHSHRQLGNMEAASWPCMQSLKPVPLHALHRDWVENSVLEGRLLGRRRAGGWA